MKAIRLWMATAFALLAMSAMAAERSYINEAKAGGEGLPFSGGVIVGDMVYLSGMLGLVDGKVPDDPKEEARVVLDAIKATLAEADLTMDDLVSVQIFCSDVSHYGAFNEVYRTYFTKSYPARAFIGSGALLFNARFEVQVIAARP